MVPVSITTHIYALHIHSVVPTSSFLCIQDFCRVFLSICVHFLYISVLYVAHGSIVVKAPCYKPEGRGFDTDEVIF
jgi:hypothetical protein